MIKGSVGNIHSYSKRQNYGHIQSGSPKLTCSVLIDEKGKWLVFASPSGKLFYQNRATQFCTWNKPIE